MKTVREVEIEGVSIGPYVIRSFFRQADEVVKTISRNQVDVEHVIEISNVSFADMHLRILTFLPNSAPRRAGGSIELEFIRDDHNLGTEWTAECWTGSKRVARDSVGISASKCPSGRRIVVVSTEFRSRDAEATTEEFDPVLEQKQIVREIDLLD